MQIHWNCRNEIAIQVHVLNDASEYSQFLFVHIAEMDKGIRLAHEYAWIFKIGITTMGSVSFE